MSFHVQRDTVFALQALIMRVSLNGILHDRDTLNYVTA